MSQANFLEKFQEAVGLKFDVLKNKTTLIVETSSHQLQEMLKICEADPSSSLSILKACTLELVGNNKILNMILILPDAQAEIILRTSFSGSEEPPVLAKIWPYAKLWENEYSFEDTGGVKWHQC